MLTQAKLKSLWCYDPKTGLFIRLVSTASSAKVGDIASCLDCNGYLQIGIAKKYYRAHRLAWLYMTGDWPNGVIDHLDGIKNNNRWCNLRDVTQLVNLQNQRTLTARNKSGYAGVYWCKQKSKWHAKININYKSIHLGFFDDVHEAGAYRLQKKREMHLGCTI